MQRRIFLVLLINGLIGFVTLSGQSVSLHRHRLLIAKDTVHLDTLSIVPGSLYITNLAGDTIVSDSYEIRFYKRQLDVQDANILGIHYGLISVYSPSDWVVHIFIEIFA